MKLKDILKKVGGAVIKEAVPGGGMILAAVNELLPSVAKLGEGATGRDIEVAIESLPPDQRAEIMGKRYDVEIAEIKETSASLQAALHADAINPQSTRPKIAYQCFQVAAAISLLVVSVWAYAIGTGNATLVDAVTSGWPFVGMVVGPFFVILRGYFGILRDEQKNKLDAGNGNPTTNIVGGIVGKLLNRGR